MVWSCLCDVDKGPRTRRVVVKQILRAGVAECVQRASASASALAEPLLFLEKERERECVGLSDHRNHTNRVGEKENLFLQAKAGQSVVLVCCSILDSRHP